VVQSIRHADARFFLCVVEMKTIKAAASLLTVQANNTANWYAWNNLLPPGPPTFFIIGNVDVPNPEVDVHLAVRNSPGSNSTKLLVDLVLVQRPGVWPRTVVRKHVHLEKAKAAYKEVDIYCGSALIAKVPVEDII
jgi:hypothetical protein